MTNAEQGNKTLDTFPTSSPRAELPVPKLKIVLETSLVRAECWRCFGGRETSMADANSSL